VRAGAERPTRAQETSRCERGRSRSGTVELDFRTSLRLGARDRGKHRDVDHDASIRCAAAEEGSLSRRRWRNACNCTVARRESSTTSRLVGAGIMASGSSERSRCDQMRGAARFSFSNLKSGDGVDRIANFTWKR
jgi:hypothetical protein